MNIGFLRGTAAVKDTRSIDTAAEEIAESGEGMDTMDGLREQNSTVVSTKETMADVFKDYDKVCKGEMRIPVRFVETRKYLQRIRDQKKRIRLLEDRIKYRTDAGMGTSWQESELVEAERELRLMIVEVSDEISKLNDPNQEMVMSRRYIDCMSWESISEIAEIRMRTVQKCHGHALPHMEQILLEDGLITLEEDDYGYDCED